MSRPVVVLHPRHPRGVDEELRRLDIDLLVPDVDSIPAALASDGILVSYLWDDRFLDGLTWVQAISAGCDQFPLDVFAERRVALTSASGVHGPQMAEHAFGLLLALTRGIGVSMRNAARAEWKQMNLHELTERTLGVLGLGAVGEEIARRAAAWGLDVVGTKRDPSGYEGAARQVFAPEQTAEVFAMSDIVISALPGGAETDRLVTRDMLESLGGWFVNVGRGNLVAEEDLIAALDSGHLLGVGLDVFEVEPLPSESPLWGHPRVVITPHNAGFSPLYGRRLAAIFRHNLDAFVGGREWHNRVV